MNIITIVFLYVSFDLQISFSLHLHFDSSDMLIVIGIVVSVISTITMLTPIRIIHVCNLDDIHY